MDSCIDKYSPEECGWRNIKGYSSWICHKCDAHRNYKTYVELVDLDEKIRWDYPDKQSVNKAQIKRQKILEEILLVDKSERKNNE